jgi:hypothetical protein
LELRAVAQVAQLGLVGQNQARPSRPIPTENPAHLEVWCSSETMLLRMARPEMTQNFWTLRLLQMRDAETSENIKTALQMVYRSEQRMEAIAQRVGLQKLGTRGSLEQQPFRALPNKISQHFRERLTEINFPFAAFCFGNRIHVAGYSCSNVCSESAIATGARLARLFTVCTLPYHADR